MTGWDYFCLWIFLSCKVLFDLGGPLALNRILNFLERNGEETTIQPWVWIILIFVASTGASVAFNLYLFFTTRLLCRTEGIITQLVFEHALRIRMKDDQHSTSTGSSPTTAVATPVANQMELLPEEELSRRASEVSEDATVRGSESRSPEEAAGKLSERTKAREAAVTSSTMSKEKEYDGRGSANLVGKINNLISTDMGNLVDGTKRNGYLHVPS